MATQSVHTEIDIDAPADLVWSVLCDFDRYAEWNPLMRRLLGHPEVGATLTVRIVSPGGKGPINFRSKVVRVEPGREIRWLGRFLWSWLFAGEHSLRVEPIDEARTRFVQREDYRGIISRPVIWVLGKHIRTRFEQMNNALKARVMEHV